MVTGGQRSGKSKFAESLALDLSDNPVYLATARIYDSEMEQRVEIHKKRRGENWSCIEEPVDIGKHSLSVKKKTVLLDCLTMLATNTFFEQGEDIDKSYQKVENELKKLLSGGIENVIIVTNEIGLGGINSNKMQRKFCDLQGKLNQMLASLADEVYLVVSGISVRIK